MTPFLNIDSCGAHSCNTDETSDVKLPLHVQCDLRTPSFHLPNKTNVPTVSDSDTSTTCTNPSPDSDHNFIIGRRRRRTSNGSSYSDIDDERWPIYPIQCCMESHESFNLGHSSFNSDDSLLRFSDVRKRNSIREERCRQAMNSISQALKVDDMKRYSSSISSENIDEKNVPDLVAEIEQSTLEDDNLITSSDDESSYHSEVLADIELTERAKKIQHDLNLQELQELAWEAERASEAGEKKFIGSATKFGIEEAAASCTPLRDGWRDVCDNSKEHIDAYKTPKKRNRLRHELHSGSSNNVIRSYTPDITECSDELGGAGMIAPPPELKRFPQTALKKPKHVSYSRRNTSVPSKMQNLSNLDNTPNHLSNTLTMTASFLSSRQFSMVITPSKKVRVMSLRHVEEVIPPFQEIHHNLRLNLLRHGVDKTVLIQQDDESDSNIEDDLLENEEDSIDEEHASSFSFFPRAENIHKLFSTDHSLVTEEDDGKDSLDNTTSHNELSVTSSEQMKDDTIDCVSFVSCGNTNISKQVLMTPKKKMGVDIVADDEELEEPSVTRSVIGVYACTLASEVHHPGTEHAWTVAPLPGVRNDMDENDVTDDTLRTPQRAQSEHLPLSSRWSSFWGNMSPKRKLFVPTPLRLSGIMSSGPLKFTSLSTLDLKSSQSNLKTLESMESNKIELRDTTAQNINYPPIENDRPRSISFNENENVTLPLMRNDECIHGIQSTYHRPEIPESIISTNYEQAIQSFCSQESYRRTKLPDSHIAFGTSSSYERAKQTFINRCDGMTMSTSSSFERAKQTFNGTLHDASRTNLNERKDSFANSILDIDSSISITSFENNPGHQSASVKCVNINIYKQSTKKCNDTFKKAYSSETFNTARQNFDERFENGVNNEVCSKSPSVEENNFYAPELKKTGELLEKGFASASDDRVVGKHGSTYCSSLLSNSNSNSNSSSKDAVDCDSLTNTLPSENKSHVIKYAKSESITAEHSIYKLAFSEKDDKRDDLSSIEPKTDLNFLSYRSVSPLHHASVPCTSRDYLERKCVPEETTENLSNKLKSYPAYHTVARLEKILKRVNERLSAKKPLYLDLPLDEVSHTSNFPEKKIFEEHKDPSDSSFNHHHELSPGDCASINDVNSSLASPNNLEAKHDNFSYNVDPKESGTIRSAEPITNNTILSEDDNGLVGSSVRSREVWDKRSSFSSLPRRICLGADSNICAIVDDATDGICDGRVNHYTLNSPCEKNSSLSGMIENVPSLIERLSPLLGRKLQGSDNEDIPGDPEDLSFVKNYFYVGVDHQYETSTAQLNTGSDDSNNLPYKYGRFGSYICNLGCNVNAAFECLPDNNLASLNANKDIHETISKQASMFVNTPRQWYDEPLFQRGKVKLGDKVFDSPSLLLKKGGVLDQQEHQDFDDIAAEKMNVSRDTLAETDVEIEHLNLPWYVKNRGSRRNCSLIEEDCEESYNDSSNEIEVTMSKYMDNNQLT